MVFLGTPVSSANKGDRHDIIGVCSLVLFLLVVVWSRRDRDRMVIGFIATCAINACQR